MKEHNTQRPDPTSVQAALSETWHEHKHTRDQTWKALQIVLFLTIGLVVTQNQFKNHYTTFLVAILIIVSCLSGISVTLHHRRYQRKKFEQISKFEKELKLEDLIGIVSEPKTIKWYDSFSFFTSGNTPMFIIRIYILIILFCIVYTTTALIS